MQQRRQDGLCIICGEQAAPGGFVRKNPHKKSPYCQTHKEQHTKDTISKRDPKSYKLKCATWRLKLKLAILKHYSNNKLICECCGENDIRFLTIDHINGGGNNHRTAIGTKTASHEIHSWIIKNNYPPGFAVLCSNCNSAKSIYGICPHKSHQLTANTIAALTIDEIANKLYNNRIS